MIWLRLLVHVDSEDDSETDANDKEVGDEDLTSLYPVEINDSVFKQDSFVERVLVDDFEDLPSK